MRLIWDLGGTPIFRTGFVDQKPVLTVQGKMNALRDPSIDLANFCKKKKKSNYHADVHHDNIYCRIDENCWFNKEPSRTIDMASKDLATNHADAYEALTAPLMPYIIAFAHDIIFRFDLSPYRPRFFLFGNVCLRRR